MGKNDYAKEPVMTQDEKDIQLESLRTQLEIVRKQKSELDQKENKIRKLIEKITQGE